MMNTIGQIKCPDLEGNEVVLGIYKFFCKSMERTDEIYGANGGLTVTEKGKKEVLEDMESYMKALLQAGKIKHIPRYKLVNILEGNLVMAVLLMIDPNDIRKAIGLPIQTAIYIEPARHLVH